MDIYIYMHIYLPPPPLQGASDAALVANEKALARIVPPPYTPPPSRHAGRAGAGRAPVDPQVLECI